MTQAWWIASELVRRYPKLKISQAHDPVAGEALTVRRKGRGEFAFVLSVAHGVELFGCVPFQPIPWEEVLMQESPHGITRRIQDTTEWGFPERAAGATGETLVFRVIAQILTMTVDERSDWYVRAAVPETYGLPTDKLVNFSGFVTAQKEVLAKLSDGDPVGVPAVLDGYWGFYRDVDLVGIFSPEGIFHVRDGGMDLMAGYIASNRSIHVTPASCLHRIP